MFFFPTAEYVSNIASLTILCINPKEVVHF